VVIGPVKCLPAAGGDAPEKEAEAQDEGAARETPQANEMPGEAKVPGEN
jgi:hypothetical protein